MTVADCDRDLWRSGRRQCPSHDIDCEYRVDLRSACSPPFAVPGIGESAGGEAAQCFDPLITRGVTRVERGRYPIWGCSGLQQHTRLPSRSRTAENRGILSIGARTIELNTVLLILGTMLGGGTFCSDTRRTPFPLLVAARLQWKGERGQADCEEKWSSHWP